MIESQISTYQILIAVIALIFSALLAFTVTPLVRVLAFKIKAVDIPKDERRMHNKPIPLLGGLAIYIAFVAGTLLFCDISQQLVGILLGSFFIVAVGILDDIFSLNPWIKLLGQCVAAAVPVCFGLTIEHIRVFDNYIVFGFWSIPITLMWIVTLTNAINLIDGLDGLACGVSTISLLCLLIFALLRSESAVMLIIAVLSGACLGFLPFNLNPAKIFMGDTGALLLGFLLSLISIQGLFKFNTVISFWVPFMVFGLPFGDTVFSFFRRLFTGKHPFRADRGHLHHKLIDMGFSQKQSVAILYALSAILGISAIMFSEERIVTAVLVLVIALVIGILNLRVFRGDDETRNMTGVPLNGKKSDDKAPSSHETSEKHDDKITPIQPDVAPVAGESGNEKRAGA